MLGFGRSVNQKNWIVAAMLRKTVLCLAFLYASGLMEEAHGQSNAATIAAALQSWRDVCSDPNPDLALGYLMDAMATGSVDVRKACLRQVLMSDNADTLNAALRVLMTSLPVVRFRMTGEVRDSLNAYMHLVRSIQTGLIFQVADGNAQAGTATWKPAIDTPMPGETATGTMTVFGSDVHWAGIARSGSSDWSCTLTAALTEGTRIVGTFVCAARTPIPVEASLFD